MSIPHGWGHDLDGVQLDVARAHAGVNSNLLADETLFDPISGNAVLNGIPVEVRAGGADRLAAAGRGRQVSEPLGRAGLGGARVGGVAQACAGGAVSVSISSGRERRVEHLLEVGDVHRERLQDAALTVGGEHRVGAAPVGRDRPAARTSPRLHEAVDDAGEPAGG